MLPARHRLRPAAALRATARSGRRAASGTLVAHLQLPPSAVPSTDGAARAAFVVSRRVGGAVIRTRVKRRLRAVTLERLASLPPGSALVVRALPPAATASSADLAHDLDRALRRLSAPGGPP